MKGSLNRFGSFLKMSDIDGGWVLRDEGDFWGDSLQNQFATQSHFFFIEHDELCSTTVFPL